MHFAKYTNEPRMYCEEYTKGWLAFCATERAYVRLKAGNECPDSECLKILKNLIYDTEYRSCGA